MAMNKQAIDHWAKTLFVEFPKYNAQIREARAQETGHRSPPGPQGQLGPQGQVLGALRRNYLRFNCVDLALTALQVNAEDSFIDVTTVCDTSVRLLPGGRTHSIEATFLARSSSMQWRLGDRIAVDGAIEGNLFVGRGVITYLSTHVAVDVLAKTAVTVEMTTFTLGPIVTTWRCRKCGDMRKVGYGYGYEIWACIQGGTCIP